ncbi:MexE family multidrug efflux RND transporter periplasmic adaptor subunit [Lysinibacillus sp. PLM2]|nr:MexE family multidrug efflux RND transporter periplasmic adaptor subunit [Lysinibacillus sp. PLM2]
MKVNKYRFGGVLFLSTALLLSGCNNNAESEDTTEEVVREIPVETAAVTFGALTDDQLLTGQIEAENEVSILPSVAGEITAIYVQKGDVVQVGQVIAQLDNTNELNAVKQAEISVKQAQLSLEDAQKSQSDALKNIELQLEQAQSAYDTAKADLDRNQKLFDAGLISEKELEGFKLQEKNARIQLDQVNLSKVQAENTIGIQTVETSLEQAQLSLETAKQRLDDKVVKATISGEVTSVDAEVGEMASGQSPLATVVSMNTVSLNVNLLQDHLDSFAVGDEIEVQVIGLEGTFEGTVSYISSISSGSGLFTMEVQIDNSDKVIKPGMVASIVMEEVLEQDKLMVPTEAIIQKEGKSVVFIVQDNKAVLKEVEVIRFNTELTAVAGELKENDLVVISGQNLLNDGDLVKVMEED